MANSTSAAIAEPSSLQTLITSHPDSIHTPQHTHLALQTLHNLQHQHLWSDLRIHSHSPLTHAPLPRPLISGLPPQRLYVHPDEQIALLQAQKAAGGTGMGTVLPEREWVLPSHLREKWSLRRFGEVFDGISLVPPEPEDGGDGEEEDDGEKANPWRTKKRVLLATVDDDSTIVYYIVHDGVVKPRQN